MAVEHTRRGIVGVLTPQADTTVAPEAERGAPVVRIGRGPVQAGGATAHGLAHGVGGRVAAG